MAAPRPDLVAEAVADVFGRTADAPSSTAALALFYLLRRVADGSAGDDDAAALPLATVHLLGAGWHLYPRLPLRRADGADAWGPPVSGAASVTDGAAKSFIVKAPSGEQLQSWSGGLLPDGALYLHNYRQNGYSVCHPDGSSTSHRAPFDLRRCNRMCVTPTGWVVEAGTTSDPPQMWRVGGTAPPTPLVRSADAGEVTAICAAPGNRVLMVEKKLKAVGDVFQILEYNLGCPDAPPTVLVPNVACTHVFGICVLPNGTDVVLGAWDRVLRVNLVSGEARTLLLERSGSNANLLLPTVLPDGNVLVAANCHHTSPIVDPYPSSPPPPDPAYLRPLAMVLLQPRFTSFFVLPGGKYMAAIAAVTGGVKVEKPNVEIFLAPSVAEARHGIPAPPGPTARGWYDGVPIWNLARLSGTPAEEAE